jgi:glutamate---cysteine ligase / carboxylate-amine ligase
MWRAIRYGLDGRMLDLEARRIEEYPANEIVDRLRAWTGADVSFADLNGAQRQRRAIDAGATPAEVYSETVRATQATFYEHDEETVP